MTVWCCVTLHDIVWLRLQSAEKEDQLQEQLDKARDKLREAETRAEEAERVNKQLEHQIDMLESECIKVTSPDWYANIIVVS